MKSHFRFSRKQRNGIFVLIALIALIRLISFLANSNNPPSIEENPQVIRWRKEIDSLAKIESNKPAYVLYPFNPNFITDYKGYTLGMSIEQIDALHSFRQSGQWINSKEQFKTITGVSQQWLDSIGPYFKFPDWISRPSNKSKSIEIHKPKSYDQKSDLNIATSEQLQRVYGIGPVLAERIINYRNRFDGGFADDIELTEVYGLKDSIIDLIRQDFTVKTPRPIQKVDINSATSDELVRIPYLDYELAYKIIEYRTLHEKISSIEELTKIEDFPEKKINLIGLYLQF